MNLKNFSKNGYYIQTNPRMLYVCAWHFGQDPSEQLDTFTNEVEKRYNMLASHGICDECADKYFI